jgi:hypothetical protein
VLAATLTELGDVPPTDLGSADLEIALFCTTHTGNIADRATHIFDGSFHVPTAMPKLDTKVEGNVILYGKETSKSIIIIIKQYYIAYMNGKSNQEKK